jgi:hypothetical protein
MSNDFPIAGGILFDFFESSSRSKSLLWFVVRPDGKPLSTSRLRGPSVPGRALTGTPPDLRRLYQIPEPGGNHARMFTDNRAF